MCSLLHFHKKMLQTSHADKWVRERVQYVWQLRETDTS